MWTRLMRGTWTGLGIALGLGMGVAVAANLTTFVGGEAISATAMNDNFLALEARIADLEAASDLTTPAFSVRLSPDAQSATTVGPWSNVRIVYDVVDLDTEGAWDATTHTYVIPTGGVWRLSGNLRTTTGTYLLLIRRADGTPPRLMNIAETTNSATGHENGIALSGLMELEAGDAIEGVMSFYDNPSHSGWALGCEGTFLSGELVRRAP